MKEELASILDQQQAFYTSRKGMSYESRVVALKKLKQTIKKNEAQLLGALHADLGKSEHEAFMTEIGQVYGEIDWMLKHLKSLMRPKRVKTTMSLFPARCSVRYLPYGNVLIMSPWNYPVLLTLEPLATALAAGNTVVLKPSDYAPHVASVLKQILEAVFSKAQVSVVLGGRTENQALLDAKFDFIFFTGSTNVGKEVMRKAANHLTPVVLELGGKSPCIVEASANLDVAAKRIVFGKFLNCGQTCVAPDYVLCDRSIEAKLVEKIKLEIQKQYGNDPLNNVAYGKIINQKHFDRLCGLYSESDVYYGGKQAVDRLKIEPTIVRVASVNHPIMQEEIFGPLLPIVTYSSLDEAISFVNAQAKPLALYCFTRDNKVKQKIHHSIRFGGGCFNDTIMHLSSSELPFGGVGESGMGNYHGAYGFKTFSHTRGMVDKHLHFDIPLRYQPYTAKKTTWLRRILK